MTTAFRTMSASISGCGEVLRLQTLAGTRSPHSGGDALKTSYGFAASLVATLLAFGPAVAADYQGAASYIGTQWVITWPTSTASCSIEVQNQLLGPVEFIIDGSAYLASPVTLVTPPPTMHFYDGPPGGALTVATFNGNDHLTCGSDRLLAPGAAATPAAVPTMSEWAIILLGIMLAGGAALIIHRRRMTA